LNRWYAARAGRAIRTVRSNLLDHAPATSYDLICTDSVLSRFPATRRPALAANWHASLRPGGMLVTATRLRAGAPPEKIEFPPDQAATFEKAVFRIATEKRDQMGIDPAALASAAALYARRQYNYPVQSQEQVGKLLGDADFVLDRLAPVPNNRVNREGIDAPSVPVQAVLLGIVARRPAR
jgi:SAM-dependent methyltransferase